MALIKPAEIPKLEDVICQKSENDSIGPSQEELSQLFDSVLPYSSIKISKNIFYYLNEIEPYFPVIQHHDKALLLAMKKDNFHRLAYISNWFEVESTYKTTKNEHFVKLKIDDALIDVGYESLYPKDIGKLSKYHLVSDPDYAESVSRYILQCTAKLKPESLLDGMGFFIQKENLIFKAYDEEPQLLCYTPNITLVEYIDKLNPLLTNPPLMFALCCSCAPLFLAFLSIVCRLPLMSFVVSFFGETTTGKSTAQSLMASVFTDPKDKKIYVPFFGTLNSILKIISGKIGIPQIFDEATVSSGIDLGKLFYMISLEEEKHRCTSDMTLREQKTWKTIVITSSENKLLSDSQMHNGGLDARLLSFSLQFTDNSTHSETINIFSQKYYGILGKAISEHILSTDRDAIMKQYDDCKDTMRDALEGIGDFNLAERLINEYAVILLAGNVLHNLGVCIDLKAITTIMADHFHSLRIKTNIADQYYQHLLVYGAMHPYQEGIKKDEANNTLAFVDELFLRILTDYGATNSELVIQKLDKAGYIFRRRQNSIKNRLRIGGILTNCYEITLPQNNSESDDNRTTLEYILTHFEGMDAS